MANAKFEIFKGKNSEFYFRLKAGNGENILSSQGYSAKESAQTGIESIRNNSVFKDNFEIKTASDGSFYFNLKAGNGQIIGSSQMYAAKAGCENGIDSVMRNAPNAELEDNS